MKNRTKHSLIKTLLMAVMILVMCAGFSLMAFADSSQEIRRTTIDGKRGSYYFLNGVYQRNYSGFVKVDSGTYKIKKGKVDTKANGIYRIKKDRYVLKKGKVNTHLTGIYKYKGKKYVVYSGRVCRKFKGKAYYYKGKYYKVKNGKLASVYSTPARIIATENKYETYLVALPVYNLRNELSKKTSFDFYKSDKENSSNACRKITFSGYKMKVKGDVGRSICRDGWRKYGYDQTISSPTFSVSKNVKCTYSTKLTLNPGKISYSKLRNIVNNFKPVFSKDKKKSKSWGQDVIRASSLRLEFTMQNGVITEINCTVTKPSYFYYEKNISMWLPVS